MRAVAAPALKLKMGVLPGPGSAVPPTPSAFASPDDDSVVARLIAALRHDDAAAVRAYVHHLRRIARDASPDALAAEIGAITARIYSLATSGDRGDARAAITAIDGLFEPDLTAIASILPSNQPLKFLGMLVKAAFSTASDVSLVSLAARTYARVAASRGAELYGHVETVFRSAIESLQTTVRNEFRRLCGVVFLRELLLNAPDAVADKVALVLDQLFVALWDPSAAIREAAAGALSGALAVARVQVDTPWDSIVALLVEQALSGLADKETETLHGSLLALKEVYAYGEMVRWAGTDRADHADRVRRRVSAGPRARRLPPRAYRKRGRDRPAARPRRRRSRFLLRGLPRAGHGLPLGRSR